MKIEKGNQMKLTALEKRQERILKQVNEDGVGNYSGKRNADAILELKLKGLVTSFTSYSEQRTELTKVTKKGKKKLGCNMNEFVKSHLEDMKAGELALLVEITDDGLECSGCGIYVESTDEDDLMGFISEHETCEEEE